MQRNLNEPLPEPFTPEGLTIRTYREGDSAPLLTALNDAFQDHWGNDTFSNELWEHELLNVPHFRPELFLMACEGDEIAGLTLCAVDPQYIKRVGRKEGHVNEVGVRRPWRKRGVASALIAHGLHGLKAAGMDTAILGVDTENPTGAVGLYERLGFRELRRNHVFRKRLK
jgi:mycothiol synthase